MFDRDEVLNRAAGMWPHLLQQLTHLDNGVFNKKHQPCPMCGGKDRFRFDDNRDTRGDGGYICSQCGAGTGLDLYLKSTGVGFGEAMQNIGNALNLVPVEKLETIRRQIDSVATLPKRAKTFVDESLALLKSCDHFNGVQIERVPVFFRKYSEGIYKTYVLNSFDAVFPVIVSTGQVVNLAVIDPYGDLSWAGDEQTSGAFTCLGGKTDKWLVCCDINEAIKVHEQTGQRVICTWGDLNLDEVLINLKDFHSKLFICSNRSDKNTIQTAENFNIKVVLPVGENILESGVERKAYSPTELLNLAA